MRAIVKVILSSLIVAGLVISSLPVAEARGHKGHKSKKHEVKGKPFRALYDQIQMNSAELAELRALTEETRATLEELKAGLAVLDTQVSTNKGGITALETDSELLKKEIEAQFVVLNELKTKLTGLEGQTMDNSSEIEGIKIQVSMLNQEVKSKTDQLTATLAALQAEIDARLNVMDGAVAKNDTKIQILEAEAASLRQGIDSTLAAIDLLNAEQTAMQQTVSANKSAVDSVKSEIALLKEEITLNSEELAASVTALKSQLDVQNQAFEVYKAGAAQKEALVQDQILQLQAEIQLLKSETTASPEVTAQELAAVNFQLATLLSDVQELQTSLGDLKTQFNNHKHSFIYFDVWYLDGMKFTNYRVVNITSTTW